jgi:hypothetical protein
MHTFFHGWRRKTGVVTLVMAMLLTCAWMRNRVARDEVWFTLHDRHHKVIAPKGGFVWVSWDARNDLQLKWDIGSLQTDTYSGMDRTTLAKHWHDHFDKAGLAPRTWTAHYLTIVLPLTFLSAYLILWKPRKRDPGPMPS